MTSSELTPGTLVEHYKKKKYRIHSIAIHSESLDELVIYEALYENKLGQIWARPKKMFLETVNINGEEVPRFSKITDTEAHKI